MVRISSILLIVLLLFSCGGSPEPTSSRPQEPVTQPVPAPTPAEPQKQLEEPVQVTPTPIAVPEERVFNPDSITQEKFDATKADVQALIRDLNGIIRARNYNSWRTYLADSYFEEISSKEFLDKMTEELYKRDQIVATNLGRDPRRVTKKILRTPKDYFDNVVVPSRSNDRMDEIDFVDENRVKAYTRDNSGRLLVLYDLELFDNKWKIIN